MPGRWERVKVLLTGGGGFVGSWLALALSGGLLAVRPPASRERGPMRRRILPAVGLALLGVMLALAVGEAAARWAYEPRESAIELHHQLGWFYIPKWRGWQSDSSWRFDRRPRIWVHINSQGLLDREYPFEKPPGARRVVVLADSFGGDFGVPFDALFPKVAEAWANADGRWGRQEVINTGVVGFGTAQEILMFRQFGRRYHPDVVVLSFFINDVGDNIDVDDGGRRPRVRLERGRVTVQDPPPSPRTVEGESLPETRFMGAHSVLYRLVRERLVRTPATRRIVASLHLLNPRIAAAEAGVRDWLGAFLADGDRRSEYGWQVTEALIRELHIEVEAGGARLAVMMVPLVGQIYPERFRPLWRQTFGPRAYDLDKPNRRLARFLAAEGVPFLDLLPFFRSRAAAGETDLYREGDIHWSVKGHALAGTALVEFLDRNGLMTERKAVTSAAR